MRTTALLSGAVLVAAFSAPALATPIKDFQIPYPTPSLTSASPAVAKEVRHGEYLAKLADCMACHTDHDRSHLKAPPFAGGLPMATPFGTVYSRNITPDKATGIGKWTFHQFDMAVRYGRSPEGYLFAAMPYTYYNNMSRAQVHAIWEFLRHIPPVHKKNRPVDMPPPFKWRWLQFGWQFLFLKPHKDTFHYDPGHSAQWNRGRFIVEGPEHCGMCHTPHSVLGAAQRRYRLKGSGISGEWAPDISAGASAPHSIDTITRVFSDARGLAGGRLQDKMLDAVSNSMHYMTPADMRAVAVYIQSVVSEVPNRVGPVRDDKVDMALGGKTYRTECASCHEAGIGGAPRVGVPADWKALGQEPIGVLYQNVWHGVSIMPPKGGCGACTRLQLSSAIAWMLLRSQPGSGKNPGGTTSRPQAPAHTVSLAVGKQIYQVHCAACHASGMNGAPRYGDKQDWASRLKLSMDVLHHHALYGIGQMPPKGGCDSCSQDQIISAADYLIAGSGGKDKVEKSLKQPPPATH